MKINAALVKKQTLKPKATDKSVVLAFLSVAVGIVAGGVLFTLNQELCANEISGVFARFTESFSTRSDADVMLTMLFTRLIYFAVILVSGTSIAGTGIALIYTVINFSSLSMIASYLYSAHNLQGLEYCLLVFYPGKILYILSSLLVLKNALEYCDTLTHKPIDAINSKKRYIGTGAVIFAIYTSGIIIDFILIKMFSSLFSF